MLDTINSFDRERLIRYYSNYCNWLYKKQYPLTESNLKTYITVVYEIVVKDITNIRIETCEDRITIYFNINNLNCNYNDTVINENPGGVNYMKKLEIFDEMIC